MGDAADAIGAGQMSAGQDPTSSSATTGNAKPTGCNVPCISHVLTVTRTVWIAAVIWSTVLLGLHTLLTGKTPPWLSALEKPLSSTSLSWVTVGFACLATIWLLYITQGFFSQQRTYQIVLLELLFGSSWAAQHRGADRHSTKSSSSLFVKPCTSSRSSTDSGFLHEGSDADASTAASARNSCTDVASTALPPLPKPKSLDKCSRRQLGMPSSTALGGTGGALSSSLDPDTELSSALHTVAALRPPHAGKAAAPASQACLAKLRRRLSLQPASCAYSDVPAHAGSVLVLHVDNSPIDQAVLSVLLGSEAGVKLMCVSSGAQALEYVFSSQWLPDIILMDVLLPDMEASEVCSQLRSVFSPVELPIVLLASRSGEADMLAALECGVNDFLIKPLRRLELMARIHSQMMIKQSVKREAEARSHYELLVQVLPPHIIERLAAGQAYIPEQHEEVTILFSDIVGFTELCSLWPTQEVVAMLDMMFSSFDELCDKHGVFKVETIGDAYMIVAGHDGSTDHTLRMAAMAVDMLSAAEDLQCQLMAQGKDGLRVQIRIGMHTGPAHSGVVGKRRPRYCFFGDTVNTSSRMESSGFPMTVHLSDACACGMLAAVAAQQTVDSSLVMHATLTCSVAEARNGQALRSSNMPWEILDIGVQHVKGKGRMRTHLLKVGEWRAALDTLQFKQLQQANGMFDYSSTCSTGTLDSPDSLSTKAHASTENICVETGVTAAAGTTSGLSSCGVGECSDVLSEFGPLSAQGVVVVVGNQLVSEKHMQLCANSSTQFAGGLASYT